MPKISTFINTTVAPVGILRKNETVIPQMTEKSANTTEYASAFLNPLAACRAVTAGKISSAETSMTPTILTDKTTVMAVRSVRSM